MRLKRQFVTVTIAKLAVACLNVLFAYLCMSRLPAADAAPFLTQFSAVMLASAFCSLGAGVAAYSIVSPACNRSEDFSRDFSALLWLGLAGIAAAGAAYALLVALGVLAPINPAATGWFLVSSALTLLMGDLNRSAGEITRSILLQGACPMMVLLVGFVALDLRTPNALLDASAVSFAIAAAAMLIDGVRHVAPVTISAIRDRLPAALKAAPFPAMSSMQMNAEIVLGSLFLSASALPVFVVANRLATLVKMPALIAFRVFTPSMDEQLSARVAFHDGDRSFGWQLFWAGVLLFVAGLAALLVAQTLELITLPAGFFAVFAVCAGIKLGGLLFGSPESLLVAQGRFLPIYSSTAVTLLAVAGGCLVATKAMGLHELIVIGLVSLWFVLQRMVMAWSNR